MEFQTCYFDSANDEQVYNDEFVSKTINSAKDCKNFYFKIVKPKSKTKENVTFDATDELSDLTENDTVTNRPDKKRAQSIFGRGNVKPIFTNGCNTNDFVISSEQACTRPGKRIRTGFLP